MLWKSELTAAYYFGHKIFNSAPFFFKMKHICKEYRPPLWTGCNRFSLVWFGAVFIGFSIPKGWTATGSVRFFSVQSGPVSVYFQFIEPNLQTLVTYGSLSCLAKHFKEPQAVSSIKKYYISMSSDVRFCWCTCYIIATLPLLESMMRMMCCFVKYYFSPFSCFHWVTNLFFHSYFISRLLFCLSTPQIHSPPPIAMSHGSGEFSHLIFFFFGMQRVNGGRERMTRRESKEKAHSRSSNNNIYYFGYRYFFFLLFVFFAKNLSFLL